MSWLDETKVINNSIGLDAKRTMGTGMIHLDINNGYSVTAIPQWLQGMAVSVKTWMPAVNTPEGKSIMLTEDVCTSIASALKTAVYYRRYMLVAELAELDNAFFSDAD